MSIENSSLTMNVDCLKFFSMTITKQLAKSLSREIYFTKRTESLASFVSVKSIHQLKGKVLKHVFILNKQ